MNKENFILSVFLASKHQQARTGFWQLLTFASVRFPFDYCETFKPTLAV